MNKNEIEFKDGYYWVADYKGGSMKTGFTTKREAKRYAKRYSFTLGYVAMALLGLSALLQIASLVLRVAFA